MVDELQLIERSVTVPKGAGVEQLLDVLRGIFRLPRLQTVVIDQSGVIRYKAYARDSELELPAGVDLQHLEPYAILRNAEIQEYQQPPDTHGSVVSMAFMLQQVDRQRLFPLAWVVGGRSTVIKTAPFLGLPVISEPKVENNTVFLCAGVVPNGKLADTQWTLKYTSDLNSDTPGFVVFGEEESE